MSPDSATAVTKRSPHAAPATLSLSGEPLVDGALVMAWFTMTLFWAVVGPVIGLLAALKLDDPTFLQNIEWLQFARLRITHTNAVVFGLFSTAVFGFMCWALPKLCGRPLVNARAVWWGFALFNLGVLCGATGLLAGLVQGVEVGEIHLVFDVVIYAGFLITAIVMLQTIAQRRVKRMYVSLWYWTGGLLWTIVNIPIGMFLVSNTGGVNSAALHGLFLHNIVGLWITPMGLGAIYYMLPIAAGARLYSHKLSLIGFWGLAFFYPLNGIHHYIYSPIADWAETIAIAASMMLIFPVWAFSINVWGTMRGRWVTFIGDNLTVKFLILGAVWYLLTCFQGPLQALRSMQALTHFGDFNVGHAHSSIFGTFAIWMFAAVYFVLPRATGRRIWSARLGIWHYRLEIFGFTLMFTSLTTGGFVQGGMLQTSDIMWIDTVQAGKPYWLARTLGGTLMDLGLALFAFNMVMTCVAGKRVRDASYDRPSTALDEPAAT